MRTDLPDHVHEKPHDPPTLSRRHEVALEPRKERSECKPPPVVVVRISPVPPRSFACPSPVMTSTSSCQHESPDFSSSMQQSDFASISLCLARNRRTRRTPVEWRGASGAPGHRERWLTTKGTHLSFPVSRSTSRRLGDQYTQAVTRKSLPSVCGPSSLVLPVPAGSYTTDAR